MISFILPNCNESKIYEAIAQIESMGLNSEVIVSCDRDRKGKGWAIREAMNVAQGEILCFIDSDMDIEPRMVLRLLPFLHDYDIVVGKKDVSNVRIDRKILTCLSRLYIRLLFGIKVDTQTGIKLYTRDALRRWKCDGFAFDIEILAKCQRAKHRMIEVPIEAEIKKKMPLKYILKSLTDSLIIYWRLKWGQRGGK